MAEGVRLYNQETWARLMGDQGREIVARYIRETVNYYTLQSEAENHAVREVSLSRVLPFFGFFLLLHVTLTVHALASHQAACQCIAELGAKIDKDVVRPYVSDLLEALMVCFRDESWPVRDCACIACGNFVSSFPDECSSHLEELYELWFSQVSDS